MEIIVTGIPRSGTRIIAALIAQCGVRVSRCLVEEFVSLLHKDAIWILAERDDESILQSCLKTGWMDQCADRACWDAWIRDQREYVEAFRQTVPNHFVVWPSKVLDQDYKEIKAVLKECGLQSEKIKWHELPRTK